MNRFGILGLSVVGMLGAACSNSSSRTDTGPIALTDVTRVMTSKLCEAVFECEGSEDLRVIRLLAGTQAECESTFGAQFASEADISTQIALVNAGTYVYDGAKARECINAMGCGLVGGGFEAPVCRGVFQGTVALGGDCNDNSDCAGEDTYCQSETPGTCPGSCVAAVALGGECRSSRQCSTVGGTVSPSCEFGDSGTGICKEGHTASAAVGAACGRIEAATTVTLTSCDTGSYCALNTTGDTRVGTCAALVANGAACETTQQCPADSICQDGTCGAPPLVNTAGGACMNSDAGPFCNPLRRLVCNESNVCEAVAGTGQVGEGCTTGDFSIACATGNYCLSDTHVCAARKANGATCASSGECSSNNCASSGSGEGTCADANTCHL